MPIDPQELYVVVMMDPEDRERPLAGHVGGNFEPGWDNKPLPEGMVRWWYSSSSMEPSGFTGREVDGPEGGMRFEVLRQPREDARVVRVLDLYPLSRETLRHLTPVMGEELINAMLDKHETDEDLRTWFGISYFASPMTA